MWENVGLLRYNLIYISESDSDGVTVQLLIGASYLCIYYIYIVEHVYASKLVCSVQNKEYLHLDHHGPFLDMSVTFLFKFESCRHLMH